MKNKVKKGKEVAMHTCESGLKIAKKMPYVGLVLLSIYKNRMKAFSLANFFQTEQWNGCEALRATRIFSRFTGVQKCKS